MRNPISTLVLALMLAAPATAGQGGTGQLGAAGPVRLKTSVVVEDAVLRLGDLFDGLGALGETAIARAPAPGRRVELDARWLAALADGYGVAWKPASPLDASVVARASQTIGSAEIEAALREALAARAVTGDVAIVLDNPGLRLHLPIDAELSVESSGLSYDPASGRFTARVVAPAGAAPLAAATVTGRAVHMTEVPVLHRRSVPGEVIAQGDVDWLSVDVRRLPGNVVLDPANLIGKSPRRAIRPGQPVRATDLREPLLVSKNSLVVLRLETDRMVLTAQGRALEDGASGQVIRVKNTKSNAIINGVVAENGTVRVLRTATAAGN
ncbi:MAG: flagellar basal body P-ring formation chaperone FlgA [Rhodospirillales bacterium]|nr:flagellar basal body P-ring formation chaperone FlgA [Rhodospirillales bacterium]